MTHREDRLQQYLNDYNITGLNASNDLATLQMLITLEDSINTINTELQKMIAEGGIDRMIDIKKYSDIVRDLTRTYQDLQTTLGIDRRTRRGEGQQTVHTYIESLLSEAKAFAMKKLTFVYCPTCNVLIGRFAPVHDHTAYTVTFQCSQCGTMHTVSRDAGNPLDDLPEEEREWRLQYPYRVVYDGGSSGAFDTGRETPIVSISDDVRRLEIDHSSAESTVIDISTLYIGNMPQSVDVYSNTPPDVYTHIDSPDTQSDTG